MEGRIVEHNAATRTAIVEAPEASGRHSVVRSLEEAADLFEVGGRMRGDLEHPGEHRVEVVDAGGGALGTHEVHVAYSNLGLSDAQEAAARY